MAEITANMVRELREKTDAPMMECKKALTEAAGDMARAGEILRIKLGNRASKAASRIAAEGVVAAYIAPDGKTGALIEVNCETDFVARNPDFLAFTADLAQLVARRAPADLAALSALDLGGAPVEEKRRTLIGKINENMFIRRFTRITARGRLARYIHGGARIGALVDVVGGDDVLARDLAMHIAASKPIAVAATEIPAALVQKEREIAAAKAAGSGKPANIVEKMVEGSVRKFLKEVTLLGQQFVRNDQQSVEQLLESRNARVAGFALYVVGEGIAKKKG
ncbi:MAG: elongation factor Ts [Betaproteobacteria bacterium]|nr:elongation factor Ts [Betaproteobacteria bacterium]